MMRSAFFAAVCALIAVACAAPATTEEQSSALAVTPESSEYCAPPPAGAIEPSYVRTPNRSGGGSYFPRKKEAIIAELGALSTPSLTCGRRIDRSRASMGGDYVRVELTESDRRYLVGSFGAGPCVVVLLWGVAKNGKRTVFSFHFTATDDPYATMAAADLPKDATAVVFGGDNERESNATADSVARFFRERSGTHGRLRVLGYSDTEGLWIDYDENLVRTRLDGASQNQR